MNKHTLPGERSVEDRPMTANSSRHGILGTCSLAHLIHDGMSDVLYLLLPVWQAEFGLTLAQTGLLKAVYSGAMALLQVPAGLLAERWGERLLLGAGTVITGLAYLALGMAAGHLTLVVVLLTGGIGATVQHPLSSSVISKAYEFGPRRAALGFYNFSGDLGKMALPFIVAIVITGLGWRWATTGIGVLGITAGFTVYLLLLSLDAGGLSGKVSQKRSTNDRHLKKVSGWGITDRVGFGALAAIGIMDGAGRAGLLFCLPFLLIAKGAEMETVGFALFMVFGGGAAGKFFCGLLAERLGIIRTVVVTEAITGIGILLLLNLPLYTAIALLPVIGIGLNGTSSVLYGTVSEFVAPERRARGFGLFYTLAIGGGASAPVLFGLLSDMTSVTVALAVVAMLALSTIPICKLLVLPLRKSQMAVA